MKKLLLILLMIPVICSARTNTEIKRLVKVEFNNYMDAVSKYSKRYEPCKVKIARLTEGVFQVNTIHLKGTLYIAKQGNCKSEKKIPIALDIYDGEDLIVHTDGQAFFVKN